jgi:hypothetical protein
VALVCWTLKLPLQMAVLMTLVWTLKLPLLALMTLKLPLQLVRMTLMALVYLQGQGQQAWPASSCPCEAWKPVQKQLLPEVKQIISINTS